MRHVLHLLPLAFVACTASSTPPAPQTVTAAQAATPDAAACVGTIAQPPEGATAVDDPTLLASAIGADGAGKLCAGAVYEATRPLTVYRVWQRDRAYTEIGRWWSFERPTGPREAYRERNVICAEWSALDAWSRCEIKVGSRFVVGPGQSGRCEGGVTLARSATNQVYIDNDTRQNRVLVDHCEQQGEWPPAQ